MASRVFCAIGLLCCSACSFPDFQVESGGGAGSGGGPNVIVSGGGSSANLAPSCHDGALNGDETGIDCGGNCAECASCDDMRQNGSESDEDCGGTCSQRCASDRRCREAADCVSLVCNVVCQASSCNDEVRNGGETGQDCGGSCTGCPLGSACLVGSDCESTRCQNQVCVAAGCTDGLANGKETDMDCGGSECAPCPTDYKCKMDTDCESLRCATTLTCSTPTCADGTQNQGESATDCGGENCPACAIGQSCNQPTDCETSLCQSHTCVPMYPLGQPLSKDNWHLITSETATETGNDLAFDEDVATLWTSGANQRSDTFVEVDLGKPEIFFKALLQAPQAPYDQDFPGTLEVLVSGDGTFGAPSQTNVMGAQWTWVDFQTAQVGRYVRFAVSRPNAKAWSIGELNLYN